MRTIPFKLLTAFVFAISVTIHAWAIDVDYKTPTSNLKINKKAITYTKLAYTFTNPASTVPSEAKQSIWKVTLTDQQATDLEHFVRSTSFFSLQDRYGISIKRYITRIKISDGKKSKAVEFWGGPEANTMPPADFLKMEKYLYKLAGEATKGVEPEVKTTTITGLSVSDTPHH